MEAGIDSAAPRVKALHMLTDEGERPRGAKKSEPDDPPPDAEALIDETLEATFPASDPPTWDSVDHILHESEDPDPPNEPHLR